MPHIKEFIARGAVDAVVSYGEPIKVDATADRKALTRRLEGDVRGLMATALLKRPIPAPVSTPNVESGPGSPGGAPGTGPSFLKLSAKSTISTGPGQTPLRQARLAASFVYETA